MKGKIFIALAFIFTLIFSATTVLADYERTADNTVPAFHDPNLTDRRNGERVDRGDRVTVHQETGNAYEVTYPTPRGSKRRWVPKNIFNGNPNPQPSGDYNSKVQAFVNDGRYRPGTRWDNCYTYASQFTSYVFGKSNPREGRRFNSADEIQNGDVVHVNASGGKSQHWLVVLYRNGNRLTTIEGNWTNHTVNYSDSAYTIQNGTLYRNGNRFRSWDCGYHFQ
ncbi:MAG: hypothetical protein IJQ16_02610 [Selenomonadaceae bacterium]|nr:hypothetical protein [Selenomonadaceae bacterium]